MCPWFGSPVVPVIGLANSTAPGFSHSLGILKPIARSNELGSGIAQSIVPAIGIALILWGLKHTIHGTCLDLQMAAFRSCSSL